MDQLKHYASLKNLDLGFTPQSSVNGLSTAADNTLIKGSTEFA